MTWVISSRPRKIQLSIEQFGEPRDLCKSYKMPTEWHMWVCWDLLPGGFEKSMPGLKSTLSSGSEQVPAIFFFSSAPILDLNEDTWQEYLAHHARGSNQHHQGEFANSEDRTFNCWVRPRISVHSHLPNLPPACWVGVFLNLAPGHKSSQLI